jgi:hypothetical protein
MIITFLVKGVRSIPANAISPIADKAIMGIMMNFIRASRKYKEV